MLFDGWFGLLRTVIVGTLAYAALIVLLRATGKRTLSKMNAFDLIVTVALGSTLATILLSSEVAFAEGVVALALLVFLQYAVTWLSVRSGRVRQAIKSEPALLYYGGAFLDDAMRRERMTKAEAEAAARQSGFASLDEVAAIVLETDGSLSVVGGSGSLRDAKLLPGIRVER